MIFVTNVLMNVLNKCVSDIFLFSKQAKQNKYTLFTEDLSYLLAR